MAEIFKNIPSVIFKSDILKLRLSFEILFEVNAPASKLTKWSSKISNENTHTKNEYPFIYTFHAFIYTYMKIEWTKSKTASRPIQSYTPLKNLNAQKTQFWKDRIAYSSPRHLNCVSSHFFNIQNRIKPDNCCWRRIHFSVITRKRLTQEHGKNLKITPEKWDAIFVKNESKAHEYKDIYLCIARQHLIFWKQWIKCACLITFHSSS